MAKRSSKEHPAPSIARGRRGGISVADALVRALWLARTGRVKAADDWPKLTLSELQTTVGELIGYSVSPSTVRSTIYNHPDVFQRVPKVKPIQYELTEHARNLPR